MKLVNIIVSERTHSVRETQCTLIIEDRGADYPPSSDDGDRPRWGVANQQVPRLSPPQRGTIRTDE